MNTLNPARDPKVIQAVLQYYLPSLHQDYGPRNVANYAAEASARYLVLMRQHRPSLSKAEWLLLVDAYWSTLTLFESNQMAITNDLLLLEVEDACTMEDLATKWSVDQAELLRKIAGFSPVETMAVLHVIEYAKGHSGELPGEQALAQCGTAE